MAPTTGLVASIDIVVATRGRTDELGRLLDSLDAQAVPQVRAIVVDQNEDDRLAAILHRSRGRLSVVRLRSEPGLSRARNVALAHLSGEIVAFADDDCWYADDLLERVAAKLHTQGSDGITVKSIDELGAPSNARWDEDAGTIDRGNVWRRAISYTIFLKRSVVETVGAFDDELGVGAGTDFGSGEETDYVLRALDHGFTIWYEPTLAVFHPQSRRRYDEATIASGRRYGMGMGRVLRKHGYPIWTAGYHSWRAAGGALLALLRGNVNEARFHWAVAVGRMRGWLHR